MTDHLRGLNPQQREAVQYGIRPGKTNDVGPLLVIAGAGSGKTQTLAHRTAHLLSTEPTRAASSSSRLREEQPEK